ncbi:MAG: YggS family pyridoxal phosphate-dependent enzyme [Rectinemataceae bacterium]
MRNEYSVLIPERLSAIRAGIAEAAARSGRDPDSVLIQAVTKFHPLAALEAAWDAGLRSYGENRVQEALDKFPDFLSTHAGARLELLGHLQSNKLGKALGLFHRISSIDSLDLLGRIIDRTGDSATVTSELLLELHTAEDSKSGFASEDELLRACELLLGQEPKLAGRLRLRGLMTMAPATEDEEAIRSSFRRLRLLSEAIRTRFSLPDFDVLSMGMSSDYRLAVEEGSTLVRIGTALLGLRSP